MIERRGTGNWTSVSMTRLMPCKVLSPRTHGSRKTRMITTVGYDEAVSHFEATKAERNALAAEIRQRGIRRREFE